MKKLLLAAAVLTMLSASAAHAADQLPEYMLGRWCSADNASTETQMVFFRPKSGYCSDFNDGITLSQEGYRDDAAGYKDGAEDSLCTFDKVERKEVDTDQTHAECTDGHEPDFIGYEEFQLINGLLFKKRIQKG